MQHLRIAALYLTSGQFIAISDDILCCLEFLGFGIITRCLAGSQIFFLDKQSETCRKKFQLWGNHNSLWHLQYLRINTLCLLYGHLSSILGLYIVFFRIWVFLNSHEVPCGISDIFSWQTIWDLSKKISALGKSQLSLTSAISQNQHIMSIIWSLSSILGLYIVFFRIWVFLNSHEVPCGISDIFSWQTIWDLSKIFSALRKSKISLTRTISQNQHFMSISDWIYCQFTWFIVLFWIWIFWIITRCLAGSQIFFLDKQSETCQNKFQLWGNQNSIGHM